MLGFRVNIRSWPIFQVLSHNINAMKDINPPKAKVLCLVPHFLIWMKNWANITKCWACNIEPKLQNVEHTMLSWHYKMLSMQCWANKTKCWACHVGSTLQNVEHLILRQHYKMLSMQCWANITKCWACNVELTLQNVEHTMLRWHYKMLKWKHAMLSQHYKMLSNVKKQACWVNTVTMLIWHYNDVEATNQCDVYNLFNNSITIVFWWMGTITKGM